MKVGGLVRMSLHMKHPRRSFRLAALTAALCFFSACIPSPVFAAETRTHTLYCGPTEKSAAVAVFSDGDTVTVLDRMNDSWARIVLEDGTIGYCGSELLGVRSSMEVSSDIVSVAKTLNPISIRAKADPDSAVIGKLAANVHVALLSGTEESGYFKVAVHGSITGYLPEDAIMLLDKGTAIIRTAPKLSADGAKTETEARARLRALSQYFEDGRYWNYIDTGLPWGEGTAFSVTDVPCAHTRCGYNYCNVYDGAMIEYFPEYGIGMQCLGYASLMSDLVFGTDAPVTLHYDFDRVRVGDHIRLVDYEHSMLVTDVGTRLDGTRYIRVTEVNADYENCEIQWDRLITEKELYALGDIVKIFTRYEN